MYVQKTGELTEDWEHRAWGYAGRGEGKNNPDMQSVKGIGPIPVGLYHPEAPVNHPVVGLYAIRLVPHPDNEMFGRSSFLMHGDSRQHPGEASHGCIVVDPATRRAYWESGDKLLRVVSGV